MSCNHLCFPLDFSKGKHIYLPAVRPLLITPVGPAILN